MNRRGSAILALATLLVGGCASGGSGKRTHEQDQTVLFDAFPPGTTVRVVPGPPERLPVPFALGLSPKRDYKVCFEKPGYESQGVELKSKWTLSGKRNLDSSPQPVWFPGLLIDAAMGEGYELVPGRVFVTLLPTARDEKAAGQGQVEDRTVRPFDGATATRHDCAE